MVHRDIKAGNILVTKDGTPKLLDFGIAKLIETEFSPSAAAETRPELRPMTLEYASPEQVRGEPITTASDVYSLGVLLYRLLTGRFPFEGADARSRMAMQQAICEKEPPRPSGVVLSDGDSSIPQATRTIEIAREETRDKARRRLKRKLSGDLDVIILKALRKDPARRYTSAEQFSEDIRRYLEGKPVKAHGDSLGYRGLRFVQRNPVAVAASAVALTLLLASVAWLALTMRRVQAQAEAARERELALEPALIRAYDRLGDLYRPVDPSHASGEYRQAVETSREFLRTHPERTDLRRDLASAEIKLGDLEPREAEALYTDALAQFAVFAKANASDFERRKDVMLAERKLGLIQYSTGNLVAALTSFSRALQIAEALPPSPEVRRVVAACNFENGEVLAANHEPEAAVAKLRKALDLYRDLAGSAERGGIREGTPAAFEQALQQVAENAPEDLRKEMTTELGRMKK